MVEGYGLFYDHGKSHWISNIAGSDSVMGFRSRVALLPKYDQIFYTIEVTFGVQ